MSEQNLELCRKLYDSWNAGDLNALRELLRDDVLMRHPDGWPEPGPSIGRDAVFRQFELLRGEWDLDQAQILDIRAEEDFVVTRHRWLAQGTQSGASADVALSSVYEFSQGVVVALAFFWNHDDALVAAGMAEEVGKPYPRTT